MPSLREGKLVDSNLMTPQQQMSKNNRFVATEEAKITDGKEDTNSNPSGGANLLPLSNNHSFFGS